MIKKFCLVTVLLLLYGCVESVAILGPVTTGAGSGRIAQSAISSSLSFGIKKQTGKSPSEHALAYVKKHNSEIEKEECTKSLNLNQSGTCTSIKKNTSQTKKTIVEVKKNIFKRSKIEDLAKNSDLLKKRLKN